MAITPKYLKHLSTVYTYNQFFLSSTSYFIFYSPQLFGANTFPPFSCTKSRYFIVKSCNRENLELSVQQGVWATQRSNEAKLNEAFDSVENIILIFSVNRTRHFQVG